MAEETQAAAATTTTTTEAPKDPGAELLAAVNSAIDGETKAAPAAEEPKVEGAAEPEKPGAAEEGAEATEEEGEGEPKEEGGAKEPAAGAPKEKQPDPVNDPIPDEIQGRTRQRMESLIKHVKESTTEATRVRQERDDLVGMVQQTGATPEQFSQMLYYIGAVNSGDPARIKGALQQVQAELTALSRMIGEPVPGVDSLASHPDLRQAVESGDLSDAHARELAAARDARAFATQRTQQTTEAQRRESEQTQAIDAGRQALNALEKQLQADPDYARKRAILIPTLQPVLAQLHPSQWVQTFQNAYQQLKLGPAPVPTRPAAAGQQPLRARQPAGQTAKAPTSLEEAINAGIDRASR